MKNKKTVLVTGGSVRLGKKICIDLSLDGYNIIVHYNKSKKNALKIKKEILVNLQNEETDLTNKIRNLEFKNSLLSDKLDLDYVETLIRDKFLFGKEGETLYIIKRNDN